jgi:sugar lactone lactonase YvrE
MTQRDVARRTTRRVSTGLLVLCAAGVLAVAATASEQATTAGPGYKSAGNWGKAGTGNGQFNSASGIATDKAGNVYVADTGNNRIQVFTASGRFVRKWGTLGNGPTQLQAPSDIDVAPDGTVWVSDEANGRLQAFSGSGSLKTSVPVASGELARGIAVAGDGSVLVAVEASSFGGFRHYTESAGTWEATGGPFGRGAYRADEVEGSADGSVYLTTSKTQVPYDARVRHLSLDGKALGTFKLADNLATRGIEVDLDCNVWVPVSTTEIGKYSPTGKPLAKLTVPYIANDIAVGPKGDLYVAIQQAGVAHFVEDKAKPAEARVSKVAIAKKGAGLQARVSFTLTGVACPAQVSGTASLAGAVKGKAAVKVPAGRPTVLTIPVRGASGKATFTIVLRTNGRPTTQTASVTVRVP